jgi:hypothetical protein
MRTPSERYWLKKKYRISRVLSMYQDYKERKIYVAFGSIKLFQIKKHTIYVFTIPQGMAIN